MAAIVLNWSPVSKLKLSPSGETKVKAYINRKLKEDLDTILSGSIFREGRWRGILSGDYDISLYDGWKTYNSGFNPTRPPVDKITKLVIVADKDQTQYMICPLLKITFTLNKPTDDDIDSLDREIKEGDVSDDVLINTDGTGEISKYIGVLRADEYPWACTDLVVGIYTQIQLDADDVMY